MNPSTNENKLMRTRKYQQIIMPTVQSRTHVPPDVKGTLRQAHGQPSHLEPIHS